MLGNETMDCAPGTLFNVTVCTCVHYGMCIVCYGHANGPMDYYQENCSFHIVEYLIVSRKLCRPNDVFGSHSLKVSMQTIMFARYLTVSFFDDKPKQFTFVH